jgi:hypothetical protein
VAARENGQPHALSLSLSLASACNPLLQTHPPWAQDNTRPRVPLAGFSPLVSPSRADPSGLGHAATIYSSVQGPPRVETPTVGTPGRGLLRVDEQLPVKLQMGSLQQPLQPGTKLRFGNLEFMSLDGSYDMILLPPPRDDDNGGRQPARRRRNRRRLPRVAEEQHPSLTCHLPRRRGRRRGNHGQAGGGTWSAVERIDDAGALAGDTSGVDLAFETKTSVVSPQHANPKHTTGDTSTLAKDLLSVSLVPEITVQSVPDATSSPSVDQEVPTVSHPVPFRFSFDPPSDPSSVDAFVKAYPNLLGYHMWSTWDRLTAVSTYRPPGSEEDDEPDSGWDFSELDNPNAMRDFMTACDYCLSNCSDDSHSLGDEDCGPSRECFHIDLEGLDEGNHLGMQEDGGPSRPAPRVDILRELAVVLVPAGGQDTQLEQIHEMQARLDEEARQIVQLRQNIGQERAG